MFPLILCIFFMKFSYRKILSICQWRRKQTKSGGGATLFKKSWQAQKNWLWLFLILICKKSGKGARCKLFIFICIQLYSECNVCTMLNNYLLAYILVLPVQINAMLLFSTNIMTFVFIRKASVSLLWIWRNTLPFAMSHDGR